VEVEQSRRQSHNNARDMKMKAEETRSNQPWPGHASRVLAQGVKKLKAKNQQIYSSFIIFYNTC
jgi:hypothetical protein